MKTNNYLINKLNISHKINASVINFVHTLSMSSYEITSEIMKFAEKNVFLEIELPCTNSISYTNKNTSLKEFTNYDTEFLRQNLDYKKQIYDQINENFEDPTDILCCNILLDNMECNGLLLITLENLSITYSMPINKLSEIQNFIMKNFYPHGMLSKSSVEFIKNSLIYKYGENSIELLTFLKTIEHHESPKELKKFFKQNNINLENLRTIIKKIREMPLVPLDISPEVSNNEIIYDVIFEEIDENIVLSFNKNSYPKIKINADYLKQVKKIENKHEKSIMHSLKNECIDFIKSIEKRKKTIILIATYISTYQKDFLIGNSKNLNPITLSDVAKNTGLHMSSIARCINNKYIKAPIGCIKLKDLLSKSFIDNTGEVVCSDILKNKIIEILANENKAKPLTDIELVFELKKHGINCSRRTITKKRNQLGILCSRIRQLY